MYKSLYLGFLVFLLLIFSGESLCQDARFRVPLSGSYTIQCVLNSTCASTNGGKHTGVDYAASNTDILAANAGKVVLIQNNGNQDHGLGNTVIIEHKIVNTGGGVEYLYSQYSHLAGFIPGLYVGEAVVKGQKIGTMGGTGHGGVEWSVHLHFEIKRAPVISNPTGGNACSGGTSPCWGYTPNDAALYGYLDPTWLINSATTALGNDYAFWNFTGTDNLEGWSLINIEGWAVGNGYLWDNPSGPDPYIVSPDLYVDASVLRYVRLRLASNALDGEGYVYFKTAAENFYSEGKKVYFKVNNCVTCNKNAPFYDYTVYMAGNSSWNGKITGIRIDPAINGNNATDADLIKFDSIKLSSN